MLLRSVHAGGIRTRNRSTPSASSTYPAAARPARSARQSLSTWPSCFTHVLPGRIHHDPRSSHLGYRREFSEPVRIENRLKSPGCMDQTFVCPMICRKPNDSMKSILMVPMSAAASAYRQHAQVQSQHERPTATPRRNHGSNAPSFRSTARNAAAPTR